MNKAYTSLVTFFLFLSLYVSLTLFWGVSKVFYGSLAGDSFALMLVSTLVSLLIVVRHAQIVELTFNISKQNEFALGILGLTLPLISLVIDVDKVDDTQVVVACGWFMIALMIFELLLLKKNIGRLYFVNKFLLLVCWLLMYESGIRVNLFNGIVEYRYEMMILYWTVAALIFQEIFNTCKVMPATVKDRYDLYILAYFSVAGVLFNYCTDNLAKERLKIIDWGAVSVPDVVLFVFWIVVLVRIVQSLHLAALDYQKTHIKGLDLFVLSVFYIFISTYHLLNTTNKFLYVTLLCLASVACSYFIYMRFHRIFKETTVNLTFEKRIQSVNAMTFGVIAICNAVMLYGGYNTWLFVAQIVVVLFNIFHSHSMTMWVKFDLLHRSREDDILFKSVGRENALRVVALMSHHFGYMFNYYLSSQGGGGVSVSKKMQRKILYLLIANCSYFSMFGLSHFYEVFDSKKQKVVGVICARTVHNSFLFYDILSLFELAVQYLFVSRLKVCFQTVSALLRDRAYIKQLDVLEDNVLEVKYLVVNKCDRMEGYARKIFAFLDDLDARCKSLYPKKRICIKYLSLVVRDKNDGAVAAFGQCGFVPLLEIVDERFEKVVGRGRAIIMQRSLGGETCL